MTTGQRVGLTVFGACMVVALARAEPQMGQAHADGITQGSAGPVTTVTAGDGVTRTYTITVSNESPSMALSVTLMDTWPSGFTLGNLTSSQGKCTPAGGNFTCALENLDAGGSATVSATYTVPATTPAGSQTNTVTVTSDTPGSGPSYTASKTMTVVTSADMSVTQSDGVTTVTAGDGITRTYTITVSNEGPSVGASVTLTDTWPSGFTLGNLTSSQGSCTSAGDNFICALENLDAGGSATVSATYTVPATTPAGSQTNTVTVTSNTPGRSSSKNTASKTTTVLRE